MGLPDPSRGIRTPICGAGGNRTLVRRAVTNRATTIPVLRPQRLPSPRVDGTHEECTAGSFPDVSVLSRRQRSLPAVHHRFCCRAAVVRPRAPLLVTMTLYKLTRSGCESELLVGGSVCAPFNESEPLGSHARIPDLVVENRSAPCSWTQATGVGPQRCLKARPISRLTSRAASRLAMS